MKLKILLDLIIIMFISGCSEQNQTFQTIKKNNITTFLNNQKEADPTLKVNFVEKVVITGDNDSLNQQQLFTNPVNVAVDKSDNIYILDRNLCSIKKYDKEGKFIKSFLERGKGPGETNSPTIFNIVKDTLRLFDGSSKKTMLFNLDGKFIKNIDFNESLIPMTLKIVNEEKSVYLAHLWEESLKDKDFIVTISLAILDKNLNVIKKLHSETKKYLPNSFNLLDMMGTFTFNEKEIFVATPSSKKYEVIVYNFTGKIVSKIKKSYKELNMKTNEAKEFNQNLKNAFGATLSGTDLKKRAINNLFYDKNDRLWVIPSLERNKKNIGKFYADIYKSGIFLKRSYIPNFIGKDYIDKENQLFFHRDKVYLLNLTENYLKVFTY